MRAEHIAQRGVEQVNGGVVAGDRGAARGIHRERHTVADGEGTGFDFADMHIDAVRLFGVGDDGVAVLSRDDTAVADLSAAFAVEGRAVRDDDGGLARDIAELVRFAVDNGEDFALCRKLRITDKFGFDGGIDKRFHAVVPAADGAARGACAFFLLCELFLKAALVDIQSVFSRDFAREVEREAERVGETEHVRAG